MQDRHLNKQQYFKEQTYTTLNYVIPFINDIIKVDANVSVLEIGCGEGGNLKPLVDIGCKVAGVDLSESKIEKAKEFFQDTSPNSTIDFYCKDIYDMGSFEQFDLIMMRDVIEHIHNQRRIMSVIKKYLKPGGIVFIGFPPWQNPFGGHQQVCKSPVLSKIPYFHLLPKSIYKAVLSLFGEEKVKINNLLEIRETGISIEKFEKILKDEHYQINKKTLYFINPNYEIKLNLKPRKQCSLISSIPLLRNFFVTAGYYIVSQLNAEHRLPNIERRTPNVEC